MTALTVPQLAEVCAPLNEAGQIDADRAKLWVRRLRHWITLGILPPAEGKGSDVVYIAAVLLRVAGAGISAPLIKSISGQIQANLGRKRTNFAKFWRDAASNPNIPGVYYYLTVRIAGEGAESSVGISRTFSQKTAYFGNLDPGLEMTFAVNLNEVFRVVRA